MTISKSIRFAFQPVLPLLVVAGVAAQPAPKVEIFTSMDGASAQPRATRSVDAVEAGQAYLRIFWASPVLPKIGPTFGIDSPVDVVLGSTVIRRQLRPSEMTEYRAVPAGLTDLVVDMGDPTVSDAKLPLNTETGSYYTVVLEGYAEGLRLYSFDDAPLHEGPARLRVVRIVPLAPPLGIHVADGGTPIFQDQLSRSGDSTSYLPVVSEAAVEITEHGTEIELAETQLLGFEGGTSATVWVIEPRAAELEEGRELVLGDGRFSVTTEWVTDESSGYGRGIGLTPDTGAFWFFNDQNYELMVKVLDGRDINGKFWVFYGALSNVEFTLKVKDLVSGNTVTYLNPAGTFKSRGDVDALVP